MMLLLLRVEKNQDWNSDAGRPLSPDLGSPPEEAPKRPRPVRSDLNG